MYPFFVTMYYSLFVGAWSPMNTSQVFSWSNYFLNALWSAVVNALGGGFTSLQDFQFTAGWNWSAPIYPALWACILATITMIGICVAVWKITKALFAVFFRGAR